MSVRLHVETAYDGAPSGSATYGLPSVKAAQIMLAKSVGVDIIGWSIWERDECVDSAGTLSVEASDSPEPGEHPRVVYVAEGWWHPNTNRGIVHDHPEDRPRNWSVTNHRLCEQVYTRRET